MRPVILNNRKLIIVMLILAIILTACGSSDPLLGIWKEPNSGVTMEILSDGKLEMSLNGSSFTMGYTLEDPDIIILIASTDGTIPEQKMTYRIEEDKLFLTLEGVETLFYRMD